MNDVGARPEVVLAVPSLQDLARQTYCIELTLAGKYSHLCLRFIGQSIRRAVKKENDLPGEEVIEAERGRSCLVVKVAR